MSKRKNMLEFYKSELDDMRKSLAYWQDKAIEYDSTKSKLEGMCELYDEVLSKFLGEPTKNDSCFIFEGHVYVPTQFDLSRESGRADELTVTFVRRD